MFIKKKLLSQSWPLFSFLVTVFAAILALVLFSSFINAQTIPLSVQYPVAELGNCSNQGECRLFCDQAVNIDACSDFAVKYGLMRSEQAERAKALSVAIRSGDTPGNCSSPAECSSYCSNINNLDECLSFGQSNNLITSQLAGISSNIRRALSEGITTPNNCQTVAECATVCRDSANVDACLNFKERAQILTVNQLNIARQMVAAIKNNETPAGCSSKEECAAVCRVENRSEECVNFALRIGALSAEQAEKIRLTNGRGPGGCFGEAECRRYCSQPANTADCLDFARQTNLINPTRAADLGNIQSSFRIAVNNASPSVSQCLLQITDERVLSQIREGHLIPPRDLGEKMKSCFNDNIIKGPGDCSNKEECDRFCSDSANSGLCMNFLNRQNIIPETEMSRLRESQQRQGDIFASYSPVVLGCLERRFGEERFRMIRSGSLVPNREMANIINYCLLGRNAPDLNNKAIDEAIIKEREEILRRQEEINATPRDQQSQTDFTRPQTQIDHSQTNTRSMLGNTPTTPLIIRDRSLLPINGSQDINSLPMPTIPGEKASPSGQIGDTPSLFRLE